eukprot:gnl/TRDRNA2_/TRDRNA2_167966_c0_seq3.p1 gnl/TRDRNA2_/TRDRNA2_167966_c0~~gnl/TRDRNA2_/TRDRNA2_167966_c0_seq3.p1  ORF type:complete len:536 (+),score=86.79 gnl/TRDRNA2_/TRDRNA2_167966_c0_seq3:39-1610(+)
MNDVVTRNILTAPVWSGGTAGARKLRGRTSIIVSSSKHGSSRKRFLGLIQVINKHANAAHPLWEEEGPNGFSSKDEQVLEVIAAALGVHLQKLHLDMRWTKARFDEASYAESKNPKGVSDTLELKTEEYPMLLREYFEADSANKGEHTVTSAYSGHRSRNAPSQMTSSQTQHNAEQDAHLPKWLSLHLGPSARVDVCSWHIDYWSLAPEEEFSLLQQALDVSGVSASFPGLQRNIMYRFLAAIKQTYRDVPYHNFRHALGTLHYSLKLMQVAGVSANLLQADIFALLIGALCHDADHRGHNTAFEVMTRSDLALRYNDISPLENHHCATAFQIAFESAGNDNRNIFSDFSNETFSHIRQRMVAGILATDMKEHGRHAKLLHDFHLTPGVVAEQSQFLIEVFIHAADVGNPLMPRDIADRWGRCIAAEFYAQAQDERRLGLPVTSFMDELDTPVSCAKSQLSFIEFVLYPFVEPLFDIFPGLGEEPKANLEANRAAQVKFIEEDKPGPKQAQRDKTSTQHKNNI